MIVATLHLHTTMPNADTLIVETECCGNLTATLQPVIEAEQTLQIPGYIVPEHGSTGKVFFLFGFMDDDTYECELLPKKGLHAFHKLTDKDAETIAEITDNLKEVIYEAKKAELNSMRDDGKSKTPAKTSPLRIAPKIVRRKSTDEQIKPQQKPKKRKLTTTPVGKLGQEISGLKLQIFALKKKKTKAFQNTDTYGAEVKDYIKTLKDYGKTKEGKGISSEINDVLENVNDIANLRDSEWQDRSLIINKTNPKTKKLEGYEFSVLSVLSNYLRATAKHIDSKFLDAESIENEIMEKTKEYHDKCRQRTDMDLQQFVEGENFELEDLDGVNLWGNLTE